MRPQPRHWVTPSSEGNSLPALTWPLFLPSRLSERRRGPRDLQFPGQSPGAAEKAAQSPHRLHRPSAGPAGAQLREAKIPERAGQDGTGRLSQPHRHAGENVVPEQKVKMHRSLLPTAPGSRPAPQTRQGFSPHNHPVPPGSRTGAMSVPSPPLPGPFSPKSRGEKRCRAGRGGRSVPPAPARRGGRTGLAAEHNGITHRPINNRYQLLLRASIINTLYSNYTIIIMMNNLLVEIGLALQRQICKRAGDVW